MFGGQAIFQAPTIPEPPQPGLALVESLDKRLLVVLRDGRKLIGTLRSFDQFANLVLDTCIERIIVGEQYGDIELGIQVIRGENLVLLGDVDPNVSEVPPHFVRVSPEEIRKAQRAEKENAQVLRSIKAGLNDFLDLE